MSNLPSTKSEPRDLSPEAVASSEKLFYGWVVVGSAFTILTIAYGIQFSFGVFMPFISADTGWDRGSLSLPYSMYVFVYGALGIVSGRLTDSLGPRIVLTVGGCLLGAGAMLTSQVHALWQLYVALGLIAAAGMSAVYVPCNATIVRWFILRRGLALSITSSGASFGMFLFPPIVTMLIASHGWRGTYVLLGLLAVVVFAGCASLVLRDPEEIGLYPDGLAPDESTNTDALLNIPLTENWTLAEAKETTAFWLMNAIFTLTWLVVFMPMVHIVPFAVDIGLTHFMAAMTISVIGFGGFAGRLVMGPISDRLGRLSTLGACLLLQAMSFLGFAISRGLPPLYVAAAVFGFSYGGVTSLFPALVGDFFGRIAIGAIVGFIFAIAGSAAAFGPLIAGYLYDATKSYNMAFLLSATLNLAALMLLFVLKKPERRAFSGEVRA